MNNAKNHNNTPYHKYVLILLLGLSFIRLCVLMLSPLNLHGDEAQYWYWSQSFAFGYFSKPPMIAWVIAMTTGVFGDVEWAVRLSSVLIHPITAYLIFRTARFAFDARTGFWAVCLYFLMPAVWLSSSIVSTDVVLLVWWTLGLNAWLHIRETPNMKWAALLGTAIGFGFLSKYAMLFFLLALIINIVIDKKTRNALVSSRGLIVTSIALAIISPNLYWNAQNEFATLSHTAANANLKGSLFHPGELIEFWASQLMVFGIFSLLILVIAVYAAIRNFAHRKHISIAVFVLTPLLIITIEAFLSRANANWAVSAYIGGAILCAHYGVTHFPKLMRVGIGLNICIGLVFTGSTLSPSFANTINTANSLKRVREWPQTVNAIQEVALLGHEGRSYQAIATDNRLVFFDLFYYGLTEKTSMPLRMWMNSVHPFHHAEKIAPLKASLATDSPVLIINYFKGCQNLIDQQRQICLEEYHAQDRQTHVEKMREDFVRLEKLDPIIIELGGGKKRVLNLWAGYGYTPTQLIRY